jgi:hypothetical protein
MLKAVLFAVVLAGLPTHAPVSGAGVVWPSQAPVISFTTATKYDVKRHHRTPTELIERARAFVGVFGASVLDERRLQRWATASLGDPDARLQVHPDPNRPGLVISYHPAEDDLMIMDLALLRSVPDAEQRPAPIQVDLGVGEQAAQEVMRATVDAMSDAGALPNGYHPERARVAVLRERQGAMDQSRTAEWITEYQFTMNRVVDGIEVVDAGLRLGVHRDGGVSSLRVTDVRITPLGTSQAVDLDVAEAREMLVRAVQAKYPAATIRVIRERIAIVLDPGVDEAELGPCVLFNYALRFEDPESGNANLSRQLLMTVSLLDGTIHTVFPRDGAATTTR